MKTLCEHFDGVDVCDSGWVFIRLVKCFSAAPPIHAGQIVPNTDTSFTLCDPLHKALPLTLKH